MKKSKDLGLLKKVRKQERWGGTSGSGNYFGKVGSYSVQGMNIRFQCLILHPFTDKMLQHLFILVSSLVKE